MLLAPLAAAAMNKKAAALLARVGLTSRAHHPGSAR